MTQTVAIETSEIGFNNTEGFNLLDSDESYSMRLEYTAVTRTYPLGIEPGSNIIEAKWNLTVAGNAIAGDEVSLLSEVNPGPPTELDLTAPTTGSEEIIGGGFSGTAISLDFTSQVETLVASPEWSVSSGLKFRQTRSRSGSRPFYSHLAANPDFRPSFTVTYENPATEQVFRIVGPAGLDEVRLMGVANNGDFVPLRLVGEYDGSSVKPLV